MKETLLLLVPLSVVIVFAIGAVFWWANHRGQFDEVENEGHRIIDDDDRLPPSNG